MESYISKIPYLELVAKCQCATDAKSIIDNDKVDSYNTYKCSGLPAGPICNPSVKAIKAAIYPNQTDYYYFCANINTKEVFYASDYEQHKQNLIKSGVSN